MSLKNFAYYNTESGLIENTVWLDDEHLNDLVDYPPRGYALEVITDGLIGTHSACGIGWSFINGEFVEPPQPQPQPVEETK